jgi:hypothetical protein
MCALALATNTMPSQWAGESDAAIVTTVALIEQRNADG